MAYKNAEDQKASAHRHYVANMAKVKARAVTHKAKVRAAVRAFLWGYLCEHPCLDCSEFDPVVLEFDHRDPKEKRFSIGEACTKGFSLHAVKLEVAKCDVRCANCHRKKTYNERGWSNKTPGVHGWNTPQVGLTVM